jgi:hypothetical protein
MKPTPLILLALGAAACAPMQTAPTDSPSATATAMSPPRQCFYASQVDNYQAVDQTAVTLRVRGDEIWRLDFAGACPDVDWATQGIALAQPGGISGSICGGQDVDIIAPSTLGPRRCRVRTVRRLNPEEVAALPPRDRP